MSECPLDVEALAIVDAMTRGASLDEVSRVYVRWLLARNDGNRAKTARMLDISYHTLRRYVPEKCGPRYAPLREVPPYGPNVHDDPHHAVQAADAAQLLDPGSRAGLDEYSRGDADR